jgi:hypothetical protein
MKIWRLEETRKGGKGGIRNFVPPKNCYIATLLHRYIATSLHCYIHRYIATLLHDCYTRPNLSKSIILKYGASVKSIEIHLPTLLHCYIATYISTSLHRYTLLHRYIAISLHCYISGRIFRLPPFFELSGFFLDRRQGKRRRTEVQVHNSTVMNFVLLNAQTQLLYLVP